MSRGNLFWGFMLILIGGLLLLSNLGILQVNVWGLLWPLVLIALGIWFLLGTVFRRPPTLEHANVPLEGARRARVRVQHGAGRLRIYAGANPGDLAEGDFGGGLDLTRRLDGDLLDVRMSVPTQNFAVPFDWHDRLDWSFGLARDIPMSLDLETGANEAQIDLRELIVSDLRLKSGASSTELVLPAAAGMTRVEVSTGAASVRIIVPPEVAARIESQSGLASLEIDPVRFPRVGHYHQSSDYETASNRADIHIETGVGSVSVR